MKSNRIRWNNIFREEVVKILFSDDYISAEDAINFMSKSRNELYIAELSTLLHFTHNKNIKAVIGDAFYEFRNKNTLHTLIEAIVSSDYEDSHYVVCLLRACTQFDCSQYLRELINQVVNGGYECSAWALITIREMNGPFNKNDINETIEHLKISKCNTRNTEQILETITYLQSLS